ncbi:MAG: AAA family ATPase, partial [Chloroflexota bacterium]|nr:AAA family ATPase [Chloroflexota bacterium]
AWRAPDPALAQAALELYTGDLLPEDPYEDWAANRRATLRATFLALLSHLADLHEGRGELGPAIAAWQRVVGAEPTDEAAHVALMRLLARSGRRRQALAQFDALVSLLERELGAEPEAATRALHRAIRDSSYPAETERIEAAPIAATSAPAAVGVALPALVDDLVGREREVAELRHLLGAGRLGTLTGPGGIGKTRLAIATAGTVADAFPDGVAFVDLAPIRDPALVIQAIAHVVGVRDAGDRPLPETLRAILKDQRRLLVLDNVEQVVEAAPDVADLLRSCPDVKVLATSRVRLRLRGEQEYPVRPLALPDPSRMPALEGLSQYAAVALFIRRGREARPDFDVTNATAPAVAEICARLDGLPLAIELAAARVRLLPPEALLARLGHPLALLTGGPRDLPARQRTLRTAIAWSHDLLPSAEQTLFRRLAVFVGGWTLDGAKAVTNACGDLSIGVLDGLAALVDHSLVLDLGQAGDGAEHRYGMLETIREYALERLEASGEEEAVRAAHLAYYRAASEAVGPETFGLPAAVRTWIEAEIGNLRAVLAWAEERGDAEAGFPLTHAFANNRSRLVEARDWLERFLAIGSDAAPRLRVQAFIDLGWIALLQGDQPVVRAAAEAAVALADEQDYIGRAGALDILGLALINEEEFDAARSLLETALALCQDRADGAHLTPFVLNHLGLLAHIVNDIEGSAAYYEAALALLGPDDDEMRHFTLGNLAVPVRDLGDDRRATDLARQALALLPRIFN